VEGAGAGLLSHVQANPYNEPGIGITDSSSDIANPNPDHLPSVLPRPPYGVEGNRGRGFKLQGATYDSITLGGEPGEEAAVAAAGSRQAAKHGGIFGHGRLKSMSSNVLQMNKLP
jgi:hypothetical protein